LEKIINAAREFGKDVIFVSNETGQGIVPDTPLGRLYRDLSGIMNQTLAEHCDLVIKVEVGIPIQIK
jgi:adenosylcobinamide kinase/adenosylcobinamide-phosphate guanylyltransferase